MKISKFVSRLLSTSVLLLLLTGCAPAESSQPEDSSKIRAVATIFPQYDFLRQIGGDHLELTMLLKPGSESHSFEPTPADMIAVSRSDLFVYVGGDSDAWVETILESVDLRGESLRMGLTITFEEAAFGCEKEITIGRVEPCSTCGGSGCKPGTQPETCSKCGGRGTIRTQQNFMGMTMQSESPCPACGGKGKIIKEPCSVCKGKGKVRRNKTLKVQVPAGIDHGQSFRLRGEGNCGTGGGPSGDVIVTVSVKPHPLFQRDGANVLCEMPITFTQAALGAEIEVPTLDGKVRYTIPEGTQTGTTFRLKGKGIPYVGYKNRGDQYVTVVVETPTKLTQAQKDLLRKLDASVSDDGQPKRKSFFDKLKNSFEQ